jgi:hypothetical protein
VISRAALQHEVCPGDGPRFHYYAKRGTSCPAMEHSLLSARLLPAEIAAHYRLQMVTCGELAARLNIFTLRHGVLVWEQPVIGLHGELVPSGHGLSNEKTAELASSNRGHGGGKEEPRVGTSP